MQKNESYSGFWRDVRTARGMTQQKMGDLLGIRFQFISAVERGSSQFSVDQIAKLIRRLKLDAGQVIRLLLAGEEARMRDALRAKKKKILRA